jgi:hypothetical protein
MFTNTIFQVPKKYENLDQMPWTPQKIDITDAIPAEKGTETKSMDFKASIQKKNDIFKKEAADNFGSNITMTQLDADFNWLMGVWVTIDPYINPWLEPSFIPNDSTEIPKATKYIIKSWDTFSQIAKKYNMTPSELKALNPTIKDINRIKIEDKINVTGTELATAVATKKPVDKSTVKAETAVKQEVKSSISGAQKIESIAQAKPQTNNKPAETNNTQKIKQEELDLANKMLVAANAGITVTSGTARESYEAMQKKAMADITRLQPLIATEDQSEKVAKATAERIKVAAAEYSKLSDNEKTLKDYQKALSAAQTESVALSADPYGKPKEEVLRIFDARKSIAVTINELQTKIKTCNTLIGNEKEINSITTETAQQRRHLKQEWNFALQIKNDAKIATLTANNAQLIASLDAGNIKATQLATLRTKGNSKPA